MFGAKLSDLFNAPNLITVVRLPVGIYGIWLFENVNRSLGLVVIVAAAATDYLDGIVARRFNQVTVLGEMLDPIIDKLCMLIFGVWVWSMAFGEWRWVLASVLLVELALSLYNMYAAKRGVQIKTAMVGKWGIFWRALVVLGVLIQSAYKQELDDWQRITVYCTTLVVLFAGMYCAVLAFWEYSQQLKQATR